MRFIIHAEVPVEVGNRLEKEGDPFQKLGPILERFKPEAVYFGMARRELFLAVNVNEAMELGELAVTIAHVLGSYPTVHPVLSIADIQGIEPQQMQIMMQRVAALS
ncbi:MAG TPA: hypothetical protein VMN60_06335 [Longimicrobiales bacterium]|nr:hypothetical protein [Longimicrobiales bacterium]